MTTYTTYDLGFKITQLQNEIENFITASFNDTIYEYRAMTNPAKAVIYLDMCYTVKKNVICYNPDKTLGFTLDDDNNVLMLVAN